MTIKSLIFAPLLLALGGQVPQKQEARPAPIQVYFSPSEQSPTAAIVQTMDNAKESVLVQAYSFTSVPIATALGNAHDRGVKVKVILDKSQVSGKGSRLPTLKEMGIPVWIDREHAIAHNKVMVIDGRTVISGSFNFTASAEMRNAENLLIIRDSRLAKKYAANWEKHKKHSKESQ
jgi:phosphatidylserine/phosphatidylglycerophosphate/cardiolipin synthase-like enzyme